GLPLVTQADASNSEIPLLVTNQSEASQCVRCIGPVFRDTGLEEVSPLTSMQEIFSARVTDLSPYGGWTCRLMAFSDDTGQCTSVPLAATDFCLLKDPVPATVVLTIAADGSLSTNQPRHCDTDSESVAFLGNRKRRGKRDKDSYLFTANAGDKVIVFLEPETPSAGMKNAAIMLGLQQRSSVAGVKFRKIVSGSMPLRIEANVPETAEYEILVIQSNGRRWPAASFSGFYRLSTRGGVLTPRLTVNQDALEAVTQGSPLSPLPRDAGCFSLSAQQSARLGGQLEVSNSTGLSVEVTVSRDGDILTRDHLLPNSKLLCCGADDAPTPIDRTYFTIALEAYKNGAFVGSTRFSLSEIRDTLITVVENGRCAESRGQSRGHHLADPGQDTTKISRGLAR
ncbi:MAG: hypothetical protein WBM40_16190, partial [Thiohalocapsa sp.]